MKKDVIELMKNRIKKIAEEMCPVEDINSIEIDEGHLFIDKNTSKKKEKVRRKT